MSFERVFLHGYSNRLWCNPSSGDSYCDRHITLNLEFWAKFLVCRYVFIRGFRNRVRPSASACLYLRARILRKKHPTFVNIDPTFTVPSKWQWRESSSKLLLQRKPKNFFSFQERSNSNFIWPCAAYSFFNKSYRSKLCIYRNIFTKLLHKKSQVDFPFDDFFLNLFKFDIFDRPCNKIDSPLYFFTRTWYPSF